MAEKTFTHTIDVENDFGGRVQKTDGLDKGLPLIYKALKQKKVRALFFISTEIMETRYAVVQDILNEGHAIGAHGHFHHCFKEPWRQMQNMKLGESLLSEFQEHPHYRWPKFSYSHPGHLYSYPENHVSLLKYTWFGAKISKEPIFYLHPFDVVESPNAPNLFCKILYSKPRAVYENFIDLLGRYPGSHRLGDDS